MAELPTFVICSFGSLSGGDFLQEWYVWENENFSNTDMITSFPKRQGSPISLNPSGIFHSLFLLLVMSLDSQSSGIFHKIKKYLFMVENYEAKHFKSALIPSPEIITINILVSFFQSIGMCIYKYTYAYINKP